MSLVVSLQEADVVVTLRLKTEEKKHPEKIPIKPKRSHVMVVVVVVVMDDSKSL